ncbi:MAG TPA: allantoinase AllB [Gaiellaceae bacterium]|nr:allantoinase AllB [Gaiellaceae bacterium]
MIVRGGTVVTPSGLARAEIAIEGGCIAAVAPDLDEQPDELDARGLHVFPGVVDAHVHFDEPGRADWEGIATGSAAVAAGGGTCFVDMPLNAHPPTLDAPSFRAKADAAARASVTDFALWGGLVPGNGGRLEELADCGVVGFKAFMSPSGIDDFEAADDATLREGMARAAGLGLPVAVHAESPERLVPPAGSGWLDWARSRPVEAELEAIGKALGFAEEAGCPLHVVHVSTAAGVRLVTEARARGVDATCETCPHYLVFCEDDLERLGAAGKCAPPIRPAAEREALWRELVAGTIDLVASDHSPGPPELKRGDDAFAVWGGISGCQSLLPALLTEGPARGLELPEIARLTAEAPAARLRLPGKGRLEPGCDADLAFVDLEAEHRLRAEDLRYRHPLSPYVGRTFRGSVVRTLVRGGATAGRLVRPSDRLSPAR